MKLTRGGVLMRVGMLLLFFVISITTDAKKVSKSDAISLGKAFFENSLSIRDLSVKDIREITQDGVICYYQINFEQGGWVLLSADDRAEAVLGYSKEGSFQYDEKLHVNVAGWLNNYKKTLEYIVENNEEIKDPTWNKLENEKKTLKAIQSSVSPLISVKWNQGTGFNQFCPVDVDGPGGHAYVGCVAVAMGQAMYVSKMAEPQGFKSYVHSDYGTLYVDYNKEEPYDWSNMSSTSGNEETARILYHCGVSIEMGYGADGSGAYTNDVASALKTYFGFSSQCKYYQRFDDESAWLDLLYDELDNNRPIIYAGNPPEGGVGHCFNLDGYDTNGLFHINWGWGGANNGYYNINMFKDGDQDYTAGHEAVVGLGAAYMGPTDITLSSTQVKENMPVGTYVADVDVEDLSTNDRFMFVVYGAPLYGGGYGPAKFYIENGALYTSQIFDKDIRSSERLSIEVLDGQFNSYIKDFKITILDNFTTDIKSKEYGDVVLYPNPAVNNLFVDIDQSITGVVNIYSIAGNKVFSKEINGDKVELEIDMLLNGVYFIELRDNKGGGCIY